MKNVILKDIGVLIVGISIAVSSIMVSAHPGRTDSKGGHVVKTEGWGYEAGTYHYHDKKYENIVPVEKETGKPTEVTVIVKGENVIFDQKPVIIDGRTLVPVRYVVEKLDYNVEWDGTTQTVYIKNGIMQNLGVQGENIKVLVNNELIQFDVAPVIINGRTLIPIRAVVEKMGCKVEEQENIIVTGPENEMLTGGFTIDMSAFSDQALTLAAIAPFADAPITITGIGHIRLQECDRIKAIVNNLAALGIQVDEKEAQVTIYPGIPTGGKIETYEDHRVAMSFALTGLRTEGVRIKNPSCCKKTFTEYFEVLEKTLSQF